MYIIVNNVNTYACIIATPISKIKIKDIIVIGIITNMFFNIPVDTTVYLYPKFAIIFNNVCPLIRFAANLTDKLIILDK